MPSRTNVPASKSIQPCFFSASSELLAILIVGTGEAKGVPRPVVNRISCAPAAASATPIAVCGLNAYSTQNLVVYSSKNIAAVVADDAQ